MEGRKEKYREYPKISSNAASGKVLKFKIRGSLAHCSLGLHAQRETGGKGQVWPFPPGCFQPSPSAELSGALDINPKHTVSDAATSNNIRNSSVLCHVQPQAKTTVLKLFLIALKAT